MPVCLEIDPKFLSLSYFNSRHDYCPKSDQLQSVGDCGLVYLKDSNSLHSYPLPLPQVALTAKQNQTKEQ